MTATENHETEQQRNGAAIANFPVIRSGHIGEIETMTVDARELHAFLGAGKMFAHWMVDRVDRYGFVQGVDFEVFADPGKNPFGGRPSKEYVLTLDTAKEIAMVDRSEQGRQVRRYFIQCERIALDAAARSGRSALTTDAVVAVVREVLPQIVKAELADGHGYYAEGVTSGEVLALAGVSNRKGLRGVAKRIGNKLEAEHRRLKVPCRRASMGASTARKFDIGIVREWLSCGGAEWIKRLVEERRGQGVLRLVAKSAPIG